MQEILTKDFYAPFVRPILRLAFSFAVLMALLFLFVGHAQAASKKGYEALQVTLPKQGFVMEPGATQQVMIELQNIGQSVWETQGRGYVSLYTYGPKYRASVFRSDDWVDFTQAALLKTSTEPGQVGRIFLTLKAPISQGTYKETFHLAAENVAWIPGGEFTLEIVVGSQEGGEGAERVEETTVKDGEASPVSDDGLSATLLLRSAKSITAKAGESVRYKVGVKNTGTVAWKTREIRSSQVTIASSGADGTRVAMKTDGVVTPGALDFLEFTFNAPTTKGKHVVRYRLAIDDTLVPDFFIDIPVEVTTGAQAALNAPVVEDHSSIDAERLIAQPSIRIGIFIVDQETDWQVEVSCNTDWKLVDGEGGLLGQLKAGDMVRAFYKNQRYYFNRGKGIEQTHKYLRFVPDSKDGVCTVVNFDRSKTRNAAYADNQFRDILELRYNPTKDRTWLINELPIDEYLYGLAETSNTSPQEYKKALVTVARTYAVYHWERATKHASEFFHMNAYADDQVYKGYGHELRSPLIVQAVEDTAGVTVNYQGHTAITPYFSRSDGRTRAWSEVWGGDVPWVKGVAAPCDARKGYKLWGHGVGMSATEALCMDKEQGKSWEEILHYFYTDIDLKRRW